MKIPPVHQGEKHLTFKWPLCIFSQFHDYICPSVDLLMSLQKAKQNILGWFLLFPSSIKPNYGSLTVSNFNNE